MRYVTTTAAAINVNPGLQEILRRRAAASASSASAEDHNDEGFCGSCDVTSYCYFTLALALFILGTVITIFSLDDVRGPALRSLGHMWLLGPIFISSGLMVAVKTVLYLRKKNLVTLILRQRALFREMQGLHMGNGTVVRNSSVMTLPPPYEAAVEQGTEYVQASHSLDIQNYQDIRTREEVPPPSYDEAMVLRRGLEFSAANMEKDAIEKT